MPTIISGNTQAASIMIGEKGTAIVRGLLMPDVDVEAGSFSAMTGLPQVDPELA
jgi:choline dehydrogenase-like flavoprotein